MSTHNPVGIYRNAIHNPVGISRNELVVMVATAATESGVSSEVYDKLVAAALDERHTLYAVGLYQFWMLGDCKCPANHAGFVHPEDDPYGVGVLGETFLGHSKEVRNFPVNFDRLARKLTGSSVGVLEVVND